MTAPYQRRRDPIGFAQGWDVAVCVSGLAVIGLTLAALAGLGIAASIFGGGWVWPHGIDAIRHTLSGLADGHPGRGLPPLEADRVARPGPTYICVVGCETAAIACSVASGLSLGRRFRNDGMATRHDAELALGVSELRRAREIIRPDLYRRRARPDQCSKPSQRSSLGSRRAER